MAVLKGEAAMTGVNLIAKVYKNGVTKGASPSTPTSSLTREIRMVRSRRTCT